MSDDLVRRLRDVAEFEGLRVAEEAADRIQGLEVLLWAADYDAKEAEAYAGELEDKLAKAVEVAEKSIKWLRLYGADVHREAATLAKLTGGKDE